MKSQGVLSTIPTNRYKRLSRNSNTIVKLNSRTHFLEVNSKLKASAKGLHLQGKYRSVKDLAPKDLIRVGFTCSKKVGNSVTRNKSKRRLKHLARQCLSKKGRPGWDYVLIGRKDETANMPFSELIKSFEYTIDKLHLKKEKP